MNFRAAVLQNSTDCLSVPWDRGVDVAGPGLDAAFEVVDLGEALAQELLGGGAAADAVVAVERDGRVLVQALEVAAAVGVEAARVGDQRQRSLRLGPDVEELHLAEVHHRLELL